MRLFHRHRWRPIHVSELSVLEDVLFVVLGKDEHVLLFHEPMEEGIYHFESCRCGEVRLTECSDPWEEHHVST